MSPDDSLSRMLLQADHRAETGKRCPPRSPPSLTPLSPNSVQRILELMVTPNHSHTYRGSTGSIGRGCVTVLNPNPNPNPTLASCASNGVMSGEISYRRLMRLHILSYSLVAIPWVAHLCGSY